MSSVPTPVGTGSIPMTSDGFPDFEAVVAAGGSVRGVIPPDGSPMVQNVNGSGNVVEYAAIVDLGDGSAPFLAKGGDALAAAGSSADDRTQLVSILQSVLAELPRNLEQARAWSIANSWPVWDKEGPVSNTRLDASCLLYTSPSPRD